VITGTPGTGKRAIGALLALERGFLYLDGDGGAPSPARGALLRALAEGAGSPGDVVVTWSGPCPEDLTRRLRSLGYEWIWLDADRGAARPAGSSFVDPFAPDGSFRPVNALTAELLSLRAASRRLALDHTKGVSHIQAPSTHEP
jgi:hypothetical protein